MGTRREGGRGLQLEGGQGEAGVDGKPAAMFAKIVNLFLCQVVVIDYCKRVNYPLPLPPQSEVHLLPMLGVLDLVVVIHTVCPGNLVHEKRASCYQCKGFSSCQAWAFHLINSPGLLDFDRDAKSLERPVQFRNAPRVVCL